MRITGPHLFLLPCYGNALGAALGHLILSDDSRPVSGETGLGGIGIVVGARGIDFLPVIWRVRQAGSLSHGSHQAG